MKFANLFFVVCMLCFGGAYAEEFNYSVQDGNGQHLGQMIIDYKSDGYDAIMNNGVVSVRTSAKNTIMTMGKLIMTIDSGGDDYWRIPFGKWRISKLSTSFGDTGVEKMFYAGLLPSGRLYRVEIWLNGKLFSYGEVIIDSYDHVVWSISTDADGTLIISRM